MLQTHCEMLQADGKGSAFLNVRITNNANDSRSGTKDTSA
jgi:hypothetical protein